MLRSRTVKPTSAAATPMTLMTLCYFWGVYGMTPTRARTVDKYESVISVI